MLEVKLFGRLAIAYDGEPVTLSSRAAQSLFAYLILTAGTSHRREKLAGMFWPDASEEKARAYLRYELWRIRKAIPPGEFLLSNDLDITFDASAEYWLDVEVLQKSRNTASSDEVMAVLSAYQGELLPGFYDDWVVLEREHLQAVFEQKMARLLDLLEHEKRWQEMVTWAEHWIALGQGPEAAYRSLMSAYMALGDRTKVVATYERCVQALAELGLEPSEETRAFAKKRAARINIPIPLTSFIGRENELEEVVYLLSQSRLVTLTGSGGVGKTRLSIQIVADVLEQFPDGIWFLDLAPLNDPAVVTNYLAEVLDLHLMGGSELTVTDLIFGYLDSKRALLILDNCEHLIESCAQLAHSLLTACENLSVLATSREALRVAGEIPYRVPSLALPKRDLEPDIDTLAKTESVRLFVERAAVISPGFMVTPDNALTIARICQRLDGIPLAIELAAARVNILAVEHILNRLDDRFNLLTGGLRSALPRHRTLRATIEWSYDLLSEKERLLFQRLAVFVGGWTLEAAEVVCSGSGIETSEVLDLLSQLVGKSLVLTEALPGSTRYRRPETIRQFSYEKLVASAELGDIRTRHLAYFLELAQQAELNSYREKKVEWMERLDFEYKNIKAALEWSLKSDIKAGQKLAAFLTWWNMGGRLSEGYEWSLKMLEVDTGNDPLILAKLLSGAGSQAGLLSYTEQSLALTEQGLALFRKLGDKQGMVSALHTLAAMASYRSEFDLAIALFEEGCALCRETGDSWNLEVLLSGLGYTVEAQGDFEQAQKYYEESLMLSKEIGDQKGIGWALYLMGGLAISQGNDLKAMECFEEALKIMREMKAQIITSYILNAMGSVAICNGDYQRAKTLLEEAADLSQRMGNRAGIAFSYHWLGWGALLQGDYSTSRSHYIESLQLVHDSGQDIHIAESLIGVSHLLAAQGAYEKFAHLVGVAEASVSDLQKILAPFVRSETEKYIAVARQALGDELYTTAWEAGHRMSLRGGIAYALRELETT